jgi:ankyrin repeat protein
MLAAYAGHAALVQDLIQRGADPNRLNDLGQAPIAGAVFKREDQVVRVLMEAGADPRAGEPNAIASARMFGRADLLGVLGAREGEVENTLAAQS